MKVISLREQVLQQLFNWIRAGESASIIGVGGVGKSQLIRTLLEPAIRQAYLADDFEEYIFIHINFRYLPDCTDRSVYSFILEQLEFAAVPEKTSRETSYPMHFVTEEHANLLNAGSDQLRVQRHFRRVMRTLLSSPDRHLVFLFDQFEDVYREIEPRLLMNLLGLREAYKYRVSYLVFTRGKLISYLQRPEEEAFRGVVSRNQVAIKPHTREEAIILLQNVSDRLRRPLDVSLANTLFDLTGGHAGLLRATYLVTLEQKHPSLKPEKSVFQKLLSITDVATECAKIWDSLELEEQRLLVYQAQQHTLGTVDEWVRSDLQLKGLLRDQGTVFSPLFSQYIMEQDIILNSVVHLEEATRRVWVFGQLAPPLTKLEFRLFRLLYKQRGEVISKDDLISEGWPFAKGGVTDEALATAIYRLRQKIEQADVVLIENRRDQGYQLKTKL